MILASMELVKLRHYAMGLRCTRPGMQSLRPPWGVRFDCYAMKVLVGRQTVLIALAAGLENPHVGECTAQGVSHDNWDCGVMAEHRR